MSLNKSKSRRNYNINNSCHPQLLNSSNSRPKVARTQVELCHSSEKAIHQSIRERIKNNDWDNLSSKLNNYSRRRGTVTHKKLDIQESNKIEDGERLTKGSDIIPVVIFGKDLSLHSIEADNSLRWRTKTFKSGSFVNMRRPNLQEVNYNIKVKVRNKAKEDKLKQKKLWSQERITSRQILQSKELVDDDPKGKSRIVYL